MASGRPRQPNDPSIMASVETAMSTVARPGLIARVWHWRYELGLITGLVLGTVGIGIALGPGWLIAVAAAAMAIVAAALILAAVPPADHRPGLVRHHAAPGPDRLRALLDPDQGRPPPGGPLHRARALRRAGLAVVPRRDHRRGPGGG